MKVKKIIKTTEDSEIEITGATLLSVEEAKELPLRLRKYYNGWWLRSPGEDQHHAVGIHNSGSVYRHGYFVFIALTTVRPALLINLELSNLKIGDCFIFGDKEFEIISERLAFCKSDIGEYCFCDDCEAEDANDYEKSDVKKFVDEWFEGVKNGKRN